LTTSFPRRIIFVGKFPLIWPSIELFGELFMKSPLLLLVLILSLSLCTSAQTYTYKVVLPGNPYGTGRPISALTIMGTKAYGSSYSSGPDLYQAQLSGVHITTGCCGSNAALRADSSGNLYGEDRPNANNGLGRIFAVKPGFKWFEADLYVFTGGDDGRVLEGNFFPDGAPIAESPVTLDALGNVWGVTFAGGQFPCVYSGDQVGCGVVFELTNSGGIWTEQVIHAFSGPPDGAQPEGGLTYNPATGNYYGTTQYGGDSACNCGTVFQLSPNGDGTWSESILYTFTDHGLPNGGVILDSEGNLYGTNFGDFNAPRGVWLCIRNLRGPVFSALRL
jgi:uncharacterized repeat protein (TIGR03803 family)